jgi:hypothetical protein
MTAVPPPELPVGVAATRSPLFSGEDFAAVRSVNSTVSVAPAFTGTFLVTLTVSPPRSYSTRKRYTNSWPVGSSGVTNFRSAPVSASAFASAKSRASMGSFTTTVARAVEPFATSAAVLWLAGCNPAFNAPIPGATSGGA